MTEPGLFAEQWPQPGSLRNVPTTRLPWRFDTAAALAEVSALPEALWRTHFNEGRHDGGWQALALRYAPAAAMDVVPLEAPPSAYVDAPALDQTPTLRAMLQAMALPWKSVRLMRLLPGCEIKEHVDAGLNAARGEARLHVPLQTGERVFFHVDGERVPLREGECWYIDVSRPHRVRNRGSLARIHLVADAAVDARLAEAFAQGDRGDPLPGASDPWDDFLRFRDFVGTEADCAARLSAIADPAEFIDASVRLGAAAGFHFDPSDVESAMKAGRRAWTEQWVL